MRRNLATLACILSLSTLIASCESSPRDIETPEGAVSGAVNGPFVILGVMDKATSTLNRPNGSQSFVETIKIDVPLGTQVIVPSMRGWDLAYGSSNPANLSATPKP